MEFSRSEDDLVVQSLLEKKKKRILGSSNPKNEIRARRVPPAER